ncbi:ATP-dependent lipid A-core flippase-like [Sycon ciliatum]|uniref:ATP-dependent lipid A-core flippase-like n=1 Tax=Sycon ciliatum TaxID=27933 RepID=UPI0031F60BFC
MSFDEEPKGNDDPSGDTEGLHHRISRTEQDLSRGAAISFRGVSFRYPGSTQDQLHHVSFDIESGEYVCITGPSGSGKSTIMWLIGGLFCPQRGAIRVGEWWLGEHNQSILRRITRVVPQSSHLFSGSVKENVAYGNPLLLSDKDIWKALDMARCNFVHEYAKGIDTHIGERGRSLSSGQQQRLALARALVRTPRVLILDESTNAIDSESAEHIHNSIMELEDVTRIFISHSPDVINQATRVLEVTRGRVSSERHHTSRDEGYTDLRTS